MIQKVLIAGIGNIFFGDDAFGVETVRQLARENFPQEVRVQDFGIRSYDLAYAIMDCDAAILVDAASRGEPPGTISVLDVSRQPEESSEEIIGEQFVNGHSLDPARVLELVHSLGGKTRRIFLVGCEPLVLENEEGSFGLSEVVQAAVPRAISTIRNLVADLLENNRPQGEETYALKETYAL